MAGIFVVAKKEFLDHVMGKKFLVILAILMIISLLAMHQGVESYNKQLDSYKEQTAEIEEHPEVMPPGWMPEKPSILFVFQMMSMLFGILYAILAIAIGFNLISGEKESGSLKSLLSHPVFRDTIINGKALGGMGALGFAMLVMTLLSIGILMMLGIMPTGDEFMRIFVFMGFTLLFMFSFFAIALMCSTIAKNSTRAITYTLVIFIVISFIMPIAGSFVGMHLAGEMPEYPGRAIHGINESEGGISEEEQERIQEEFQEWWDNVIEVKEMFSIGDPKSNFEKVSSAVLNPGFQSSTVSFGSRSTTMITGSRAETSILEALGMVWKNLLVLLVFPVIMFAIAYVKFMRMDIR
ncbi:ABC-2 type transport system permease protein [ANME-1 cluster archaeon GoMg1]|nr:ABC-2 type transport system permease protein [ANME-1 cluster archaeon GoMg1]